MAPETNTLWEKVAGNLQEWYTDAVGWTGEKARIGVKKMEILGIQHNVKRSMTHLGGRVYDLIQRGVDVQSDEQVQMILSNLRKLEGELAVYEREIDELRSRRGEETDEPKTASAQESAAPATADDTIVTSSSTASTPSPPPSNTQETP